MIRLFADYLQLTVLINGPIPFVESGSNKVVAAEVTRRIDDCAGKSAPPPYVGGYSFSENALSNYAKYVVTTDPSRSRLLDLQEVETLRGTRWH